jgi:hypothetical protein
MPALADEITRLSKENAELRNQIQGRTPEILIEGLTYEQMKRILDRRGLLSLLINLREGQSFDLSNELDFQDLQQMGLVNIVLDTIGTATFHTARLTNSGRVFANRLKAEEN